MFYLEEISAFQKLIGTCCSLHHTVQDCFLFQHTKHPTHYRADLEPTLIDLILTNEDEMVQEITHLPPPGKSRHSGLLFDNKCYSSPSKSINKKKIHKFYAGDYDGMKQFLEDFDMMAKVRGKTAEDSWTIIDV